MRLKTELALVVVFIFLVTSIVAVFASKWFVQEASQVLFDSTFEDIVATFDTRITSEKEHMTLQLSDYAIWDDMRDRLSTGDREWIERNADLFLFEDESYNLDVVSITSDDGQYNSFFSNQLVPEAIDRLPIYLEYKKTGIAQCDFVMIDGESFLFAISRITDGDGQNSNGDFLMMRKVDDAFLGELQTYLSAESIVFKAAEGLSNQYIKADMQLEGTFLVNDMIAAEVIVDVSDKLQAAFNVFQRGGLVFIVFFIIAILFFILYIDRHTKNFQHIIKGVSYMTQGNYLTPIGDHKSYEAKRLIEEISHLGIVIDKQITALRDHQLDTLAVIIKAVEAKDFYTSGHSRRVSEYARFVAMKMLDSESEIQLVVEAAVMHDIGKIGISDAILTKPGRLSESEYKEIKTHPIRGYDILMEAEYFRPILDSVKYHHEYFNGLGYPDGLEGENIPFAARILAVVDAFDAMTSERVYRSNLSFDQVKDVFVQESGRQFDPEIVNCLLTHWEDFLLLYRQLHEKSDSNL